jgi:hypothetical protein
MQDLDMYTFGVNEVKFPLNTKEAMILLCGVLLFSFLFTNRSFEIDKNQKDLLEKIDEMNTRNRAIEEGLLVIMSAANSNMNSISLLEDSIRQLSTHNERTTDIYATLVGICNDINKKLRVNGMVLKRN